MRVLQFVSLVATVVPLAVSQQMVPAAASSTFPGCAVACAALMQAQSQCIPPIVLASTQLSYDKCFCQSPLLQAMYSSPDALCTKECTAEFDRQTAQKWFVDFCQQVQQGVDPVAAAAPTTLVTSQTSSTSTSPTSSSSQSTNSGSNPDTDPNFVSERGSAWFASHWRWVVMIIVLFVGLGTLAFVARWLKKRHDRKVDAKRASMSGFPTTQEKPTGTDKDRVATSELWGPHQHMHASQGHQHTYDGVPMVVVSKPGSDTTPKNKGKSSVEVSEVTTDAPARPRSSGLRSPVQDSNSPNAATPGSH